MRKAAFTVSDGEGKIEITVVDLPEAAGELLPNVNRWRQQIQLNDVSRDELSLAVKKITLGDVRLVDEARNVDREVKIWMNNPLRFAGETFYQSARTTNSESGAEITILQVVSNSGWMIPYVSCMNGRDWHVRSLLGCIAAVSPPQVSNSCCAGQRATANKNQPRQSLCLEVSLPFAYCCQRYHLARLRITSAVGPRCRNGSLRVWQVTCRLRRSCKTSGHAGPYKENPATTSLTSILSAYTSNNQQLFNDEVAKYQHALEIKPPSKYDSSKTQFEATFTPNDEERPPSSHSLMRRSYWSLLALVPWRPR